MSSIRSIRNKLVGLYNRLLDETQTEEKKQHYEEEIKKLHQQKLEEYKKFKQREMIDHKHNNNNNNNADAAAVNALGARLGEIAIPFQKSPQRMATQYPHECIKNICQKHHLSVNRNTSLKRLLELCQLHAPEDPLAAHLVAGWHLFWKLCCVYNSSRFIAAQSFNSKQKTSTREQFISHAIGKLYSLQETRNVVGVANCGTELLQQGDQTGYDKLMFFIAALGLHSNGAFEVPSDTENDAAYLKQLSTAQMQQEILYYARHKVCIAMLHERIQVSKREIQAYKTLAPLFDKMYMSLQLGISRSTGMAAEFVEEKDDVESFSRVHGIVLRELGVQTIQEVINKHVVCDLTDVYKDGSVGGASWLELVERVHQFVENADVYTPKEVRAKCSQLFEKAKTEAKEQDVKVDFECRDIDAKDFVEADDKVFYTMSTLLHDAMTEVAEKLRTASDTCTSLVARIEKRQQRDQECLQIIKQPTNRPIELNFVVL